MSFDSPAQPVKDVHRSDAKGTVPPSGSKRKATPAPERPSKAIALADRERFLLSYSTYAQELEHDLEHSNGENTRLHQELDSSRVANVTLRTEIEQATRERDEYAEKCREAALIGISCEADLENATAELKTLREANKTLEAQQSAAQQNVLAAEMEGDSWKSCFETMQKLFDAPGNRFARMKELETRLDSAIRERDELRLEYQHLEADNIAAQDQFERAVEERNAARVEYEAKEREHLANQEGFRRAATDESEALEKAVDKDTESQSRIKGLETRVARLLSNIDNDQSWIAHAHTKSTNLEKQITSTKAELKQVQVKLHASESNLRTANASITMMKERQARENDQAWRQSALGGNVPVANGLHGPPGGYYPNPLLPMYPPPAPAPRIQGWSGP
jgi:chromosome segregation ATPase